MATLQATTKLTRKILALVIMTVVAVFLLISLISIGKLIQSILFPTPTAPPAVAFGKLPLISFPQSAQKYTYTLNTLTGDLPQFPDRAKIFKLEEQQPSLLALDKAKDKVKGLSITTDPVQISPTVYKWTLTDDLSKDLLLNIITYDFSISSTYLTNPSVEAGTNLPDQNNSIELVTNFLNNFLLTPTDLDTGKTKVSLFAISNGQLIPATSFSSTQIVRVDLFQKDIDSLPILYDQPATSTINFLTAGGANQPQIVEAHFAHRTITDTSTTYPIVTAKQAYDALQKGNAYIASSDPSTTSVTIRNVFLAYYLGQHSQKYLEPIVVFQGDTGFTAYVPAITDGWVSK